MGEGGEMEKKPKYFETKDLKENQEISLFNIQTTSPHPLNLFSPLLPLPPFS